MERIKKMLFERKKEELKKLFEDLEYEFYTDILNQNHIDFYYGIEQYDILMEVLGKPDKSAPLIREMIDRNRFLDDLQIFQTNIEVLYFIRMEQYGYADEDAVVYRLIFTYDINSEAEECLKFMREHDFIKDRNNLG